MIEDVAELAAGLVGGLVDGRWSLLIMAALVLGDAVLVVIPGEVAVTALGALSVSEGSPPLPSVIVVAAGAAFAGDVAAYLVGRRVGLHRWRWMRRPRVQAGFAWATERLARRSALVVFTARFVPFARLAVNLTAGAARIGGRHILATAVAAYAWAVYQAAIGAVLAAILPGGPLTAVAVSIVVAVAVGFALDALVTRLSRRRRP